MVLGEIMVVSTVYFNCFINNVRTASTHLKPHLVKSYLTKNALLPYFSSNHVLDDSEGELRL